ncbi:hypothetical protein CSC2_12610 [Clostridium zeae]|uniref:P22 coat protein-protein 5 domain protein n=1 Tax=Clostridium zeae TaxID=2759022 RepID=A0ABQ1E7N5_9CLOT|nr:hypothetical protein [Clostridium zeae]GFZ30735.1 hypothetical protein CSC2_12610 [Clostridium zeae]
MAVSNFIPTIWEARLIANYHKASVADVVTTPPTEIKGNKVIFNNVGSVAIKDYIGEVQWDDLETPTVEIDMDQKKYWAIKLDDVDKIQAAGELIDAHTAEAAATLNELIDTHVLSKVALGAGKKLGAKTVNGSNAYDLLVDMGTELNKRKVPKVNRYAVINSDFLGLLSKDDRFAKQPVTLENGVVEGQIINGFQLIVSEELPVNAGAVTVIGLYKGATGHGKQLEETEAMRLQGAFADGMRGLCVHGTGVIKKEGIVTAEVTIQNAAAGA